MPVDREMLTKAFPREALKTREGGGNKRLTYVEGHTVIHRLNDACGDEGWSFQIMREWSEDVAGGGTLLKALVELTLPGLGSRQHIGVQKLRGNDGEDIHKGAVTDGLKKAATLFGVGLELYGPDYEGDEPAASPEIARRPIQQAPPASRGSLLPNGSPREQVTAPAQEGEGPCPECNAPAGKPHTRKCPSLARPADDGPVPGAFR
jgi:Rad52/22 family double-strand break repair protein